MDKNTTVFDAANRVLGTVVAEKPSPFIPFKGKFPLLEPCLEEEYQKEVTTSKLLSEAPIWVQDIILKATKIQNIEDSFVEYLKMNGIFHDWKTMKSTDKATELIRFLNANSMSLEYLNI